MLTDSLFHWNFKFILNFATIKLCPVFLLRVLVINLLGLNNLLNCGSDCFIYTSFLKNLGLNNYKIYVIFLNIVLKILI
jgi:hypothetical protein